VIGLTYALLRGAITGKVDELDCYLSLSTNSYAEALSYFPDLFLGHVDPSRQFLEQVGGAFMRKKEMMKQSQVQGRQTNHFQPLFGAVVVGIALFVLLEVIVQLLPPHYNPISQSESALAVGPYGFLMALGFAIGGVLTLIFIVAFRRVVPKEGQSRSGLILLGVAALCKFIITFVSTDLTPRPQTIHGTIHAIVALTSFFCGALGVLLLARSLRHVSNVHPSPRFLVGLATVTLVWSVIVIVTVAVSAQIGVWGLLERIATGLYLLWVLIVSLGLWHAPSLVGTPGQTAIVSIGGEDLAEEVLPRSL
jgi:hypothetical membrane protein